MTDLRICRLMHWTLDDVLALDPDVYAILVEELTRDASDTGTVEAITTDTIQH